MTAPQGYNRPPAAPAEALTQARFAYGVAAETAYRPDEPDISRHEAACLDPHMGAFVIGDQHWTPEGVPFSSFVAQRFVQAYGMVRHGGGLEVGAAVSHALQSVNGLVDAAKKRRQVNDEAEATLSGVCVDPSTGNATIFKVGASGNIFQVSKEGALLPRSRDMGDDVIDGNPGHVGENSFLQNVTLQPGTRVALCSKGLTVGLDSYGRDRMPQRMQAASDPDPQAAADGLMRLAGTTAAQFGGPLRYRHDATLVIFDVPQRTA